MKLKINELFKSPNATREPFEINGASGELIRVEEGIMVIFDEIQTVQEAECVRCGKKLKIDLNFQPGEWLYYEKKPRIYDDASELLRIDTANMQIDLSEPVRQEIALNSVENPVCDPPCVKYETDEEKGVKALEGLKGLMG